ncbi:Flavin-containing monooxygenase [Wickerhamomyces ciferrii]|uniref:Flavin-containing monooxygenase n=1 Tax=Wickerhamomyces ciferrii (strain ATCC 14091 / BCRC 22168 / CBS 111 / JCM 3599 / NBRC 0793 / NRRL Y-1031 F-60-10) TaxID=1206466 RepID=K0KUS8_WICCF|nr:Flavin-containing monooxygenase [Wickerhamomyces ciferrii]CCH44928.1 Flavin-containing monooxygenase [Wickerhamomyces ciferrii]
MTQSNEVKLPKRVKSIAIIGGGASGAITLDSLIQEGKFDKITLYERRDVLGGVWVLDHNPDQLDIPPGQSQDQLDPKVEIPNDLKLNQTFKTSRSKQQRYLHTASYEDLRTNIPEQLMTYSDEKTWGADPKLKVEEHYIRGIAIQNYIERYINRHSKNVVLRTTVESINKDYSIKDGSSQFELTLRKETNLKDQDGNYIDEWSIEKYDAVVIATGHYHVPYIPNVPGLNEVYQRFPSKIKHSKTFRASNDFKDQTLIVIGSRASGADIVEIASNSAKFIYQSKRSEGPLRFEGKPNTQVKPTITKYELLNNKDIIVHFKDGSIVKNPDQIIYATGFRFSYPFLKDLYPNFTTGYINPDLYLHTFSIKDPLLSVIGAPTDAISFRAFEFQAILLSRFLSGKIHLPSLQEQIEWTLERFITKGDNRAYHTIDLGGKLEYLAYLTELGGGVEPLGGTGRPFPTWTQSDLELHAAIQERFKKFFGEGELNEEQKKL